MSLFRKSTPPPPVRWSLLVWCGTEEFEVWTFGQASEDAARAKLRECARAMAEGPVVQVDDDAVFLRDAIIAIEVHCD